jgi:hypothetical protein
MNELERVQSKDLVFSTSENFEHFQRMAKGLAQSSMIPNDYRNNIPNVLIALDIANQMRTSPLTVMQNMDIIHGKPSWSSKYIIGLLKSYPKLKNVSFNEVGQRGANNWGYFVTATDVETGQQLKGVTVDMNMANAEGWVNKKGSKWKTMPELMLQYRAAAFFCRIHTSEILFGFHTSDEMSDVHSPIEDQTAQVMDDHDDEELPTE